MLGPGDAFTNTSCLSREVLQENKPQLQEIDSADPINYTFELYEEVPDAVPLDISGSDEKLVVHHLGGVGG